MKNKIIIGIVGVVIIAVGVFVFLNLRTEPVQIGEGLVEAELGDGVTEIVYWQKDARYFYEIELLKMALDNTVDEYGPYIIKPHELDIEGNRGMKMLEAGEVDVSFHSVTIEREERLLPIKVSLLRGLLGYRIFLIRDIIEPSFRDVETLEELSEFTAGFGAQWGDMSILEANNIKVEGFTVYNDIFEALTNGKVDYFPRGINEIWGEVEKFKDEYPNIKVEENLAFYYPFLRYYFVTPGNTELAQRIEEGLKIAEDDGTFKELFFEYFGEDIERANLINRTIFVLENPTMTDREIDTSWWLNN